jgi:voltage-gated potassium channel
MKRPSQKIFNIIDTVTILLTFIALGLMVAEESVELDTQMLVYFVYADFLICSIFLSEFFFMLYFAEDKKAFWKRHWIDLVASIPLQGILQNLRWGRAVRLIRVVRVLRTAKIFILLLRIVARVWDRYKKNPTRFSVLMMILAIFMGAASVMFVELYFATPDADGITQFGDALWWALVTVSTVGYGDITPVTTAGRLIASFLIVVGVGLYASFNAILASALIRYMQTEGADNDEKILEELKNLRRSVEQLKEQGKDSDNKENLP